MLIEAAISILRRVPEEWVEFSAGQNSVSNIRRFRAHDKLFFRYFLFLGYFKFVWERLSFTMPHYPQKDILFFASSRNQVDVLAPVAAKLSSDRYNFVCAIKPNAVNRGSSVAFSYAKIPLCKVLPLVALHIIRFPFLVSLAVRKFEVFCMRGKSFLLVHFWLIHHLSMLAFMKPKLVLVANDHNADTRSLIEACKYLNVKTGYVQHAEISTRFHSLDFDVSFLFGRYSHDIYQLCDQRRAPNTTPPRCRRYALVGSTKNSRMVGITMSAPEKFRFGLLIKGVDSTGSIKRHIQTLQKFGEVSLRPHPSFGARPILTCQKLAESLGAFFSDPNLVSPEEYLKTINALVSGNSTMLLEAATLNIAPIYLCSLSDDVYDYYGFVKNGLVFSFKDVSEITDRDLARFLSFSVNVDALQKFNASCYTNGFGHEADTVANLVLDFLGGDYSKLKVF